MEWGRLTVVVFLFRHALKRRRSQCSHLLYQIGGGGGGGVFFFFGGGGGGGGGALFELRDVQRRQCADGNGQVSMDVL